MSALVQITDRIKSQQRAVVNIVRSRLFGANNERLDFIMDSFYKLSSNQQMGVLAAGVAIVILVLIGSFTVYLTQVSRLKTDLANSFAALDELESLRVAYEQENGKYEKVVDMVKRRTRGMQMRPFFEKKANDLSVTVENLTEKTIPLANENALSAAMQEVTVEMRLPKISVPRMLNFLVEVEKANKYLRVRDLTVRGRYGTKLFFDGQATIRGYDVKK